MDEGSEITEKFLVEHSIVRVLNGNELVCFNCRTCSTTISHAGSVRTHCRTFKHHEIIQRKKHGVDLFHDITVYHRDCLVYSLEYMIHDRGMNSEDIEKRLEIIQELEIKLQSVDITELESVTLQMYGSSTFQMGVKHSDVNCFMLSRDYAKAVGKVMECLKGDVDCYSDVKAVPAPKNPRISALHVESGLVILINQYSERSENLGELMKLYSMVDPRVIQLAQLLKIHAKELNLDVNSIFANHVFYLMTVYFCQHVTKPLLPCPNIDYSNVMGRQEEEKKRKNRAKTSDDKVDDATLRLFAGNFVLQILQQALVITALEDEIEISMDSVNKAVDNVREKLCPEPPSDKNPWNVQPGGGEPTITLETKPGSLPSDEVNWGNIPEYENVEEKISLNEWGHTFLTAARQQTLEWKIENTDSLPTLWLKLLRFYAKFNFANRIVSIRQLGDMPVSEKDQSWAKSTCMIEDPFQPWVMLYNQVNKGGRRKKRGQKGAGFEMCSHLKHTFRLAQHYYEAPHKKSLCFGNKPVQKAERPEPPFSFFELAIRYEIPTAITDLFSVPEQQMLPPLSEIGPEAMDALLKIVQKVMELYSMKPHHVKERQKTFDAMRDLIRDNVSKDAEPVWFGSSRNGLGLNTSDLDITLKLKDPFQDPVPLLRILANSIKTNSKKFVFVDIVEMCRVPIVKFSCVDTDLTGDIAVGNMLAIRNTDLLKTYTDIDERVRELGYLIKILMKECECADASTGSLSSYGYSMMVIYFLQQVEPPVIPVLQELNVPSCKAQYIVEEWDTYFYRDVTNLSKVWTTTNTDNSAELALKFFKFYYEDFDYTKHVIAPKQEERLDCTTKGWFRSINIEDPFNLDHNLGKQVSHKTFDIIKIVFRQAYLRYSLPPINGMQITIKYYLDAKYLLDGKAPPRNFICFRCHSRDHYISECPEAKSTVCTECNEKDHTKVNCPRIRCFNCNQTGHITKDCPEKQHHKGDRYTKAPYSPAKNFRKNEGMNSPNWRERNGRTSSFNEPEKRHSFTEDKPRTSSFSEQYHNQGIQPKHSNNVDEYKMNSISEHIKKQQLLKTQQPKAPQHQHQQPKIPPQQQQQPKIPQQQQQQQKTPQQQQKIPQQQPKTKTNRNHEGAKARTMSESNAYTEKTHIIGAPVKLLKTKQGKNKKKRPSSESDKELGSSVPPLGSSVPPLSCSVPLPPLGLGKMPAVPPGFEVPQHSVLIIKTKTEGGPAKEPVQDSSPVNRPPEVKEATHMRLLGDSVMIPMPAKAKENSRQKQSKSSVRKELYGDERPKNIGATRKLTKNIKHNTGPQGGKKKMAKFEVYEAPSQGSTVEEGSRYGPRVDDDGFGYGQYAPNPYEDSGSIVQCDPDDLSTWGDLMPSNSGDPIMGAVMDNAVDLGQWEDYLSSSPEKSATKPASKLHHPERFGSPPKNSASHQLMKTLQEKPKNQKNESRWQSNNQKNDPQKQSNNSPRNKKQKNNQRPRSAHIEAQPKYSAMSPPGGYQMGFNELKDHEQNYNDYHNYPPPGLPPSPNYPPRPNNRSRNRTESYPPPGFPDNARHEPSRGSGVNSFLATGGDGEDLKQYYNDPRDTDPSYQPRAERGNNPSYSSHPPPHPHPDPHSAGRSRKGRNSLEKIQYNPGQDRTSNLVNGVPDPLPGSLQQGSSQYSSFNGSLNTDALKRKGVGRGHWGRRD